MTLHPSFTPKIHIDESPVSACSRVAATVGRNARDFCLDMGISFAGIVEGHPSELAKLASACRLGSDFPGIAITGSGRSFRIAGQAFTRDSLSRQRLRVCPCCLEEDMERGVGAPLTRPYGRTIWQVASIRTCPVHLCPLVVAADDPDPCRVHDFAQLVFPDLDRLRDEATRVERRHLSGLEKHLLARLSPSGPTTGWFASFPAYAVCRMAETIGAVATFGRRFKSDKLSDNDWHIAGATGFEIADAGEKGIAPFLDRLRVSFERSRAPWGGRTVFGRLYEWLAHDNDDPAYEPLRTMIRDYVVRTMPVWPGDTFLGKPVDRRLVHSVHTLHQETGTHPKRLRKLLVEAGVLDKTSAGLSDERATFPAAVVSEAEDRLLGTMSLAKAARYLNAPRPHDRILLEEGFVSPVVLGSKRGEFKHVIARADLDRFLARLLGNAEPLEPHEHSLCTIPAAAKRANCSAAEIVRLVLDDQLATVRNDPGERGYLAVRVDPAEVLPLVRKEGHGALSLREVMRVMGTNDAVVKALVVAGHLPSRRAVNPVNRCPQTVVDVSDLESFKERYVSLAALSKERSRHFHGLKVELTAAGIGPVFDPAEIGAQFFDRASCDVALFEGRARQATG